MMPVGRKKKKRWTVRDERWIKLSWRTTASLLGGFWPAWISVLEEKGVKSMFSPEVLARAFKSQSCRPLCHVKAWDQRHEAKAILPRLRSGIKHLEKTRV